MALFGVLPTACGIVALIRPEATFAEFADILAFVFLIIGILWTVGQHRQRMSRLGQARPRRAFDGDVQEGGLFGCSPYRRRPW